MNVDRQKVAAYVALAGLLIAALSFFAVTTSGGASTETQLWENDTKLGNASNATGWHLRGSGNDAYLDFSRYDPDAVSRWDLNETSGSTAFDDVASNDLSATSGVTPGVEGVSGKAYDLPLSDNLATSSDLNLLSDGEYSISLWLNYSGDGDKAYEYISDYSPASGNFVALSGTANGAEEIGIIAEVYDNGFEYANSGVAPKTGWHHYTLTVENDNRVRVYEDGTEILNTTLSYDLSQIPGGARQMFGGSTEFGNGIAGDYDEARIFNDTLSAEEVQTLYEDEEAKFNGKATKGYYVGEPHTKAATGGVANLTLVNATATVEWWYNDSGSWTTEATETYNASDIESDTFTRTANLSAESDTYRANITTYAYEPSYRAQINAEGVEYVVDSGGEEVDSDTFDELQDEFGSVVALDGARGTLQRWLARLDGWLERLFFDEESADAAEQNAAEFEDKWQEHEEAYLLYLNTYVNASDSRDVLKLDFKLNGERATRYVVFLHENGAYEASAVVNQSSREVDYSLNLEGFAAENAAEEVEYFHREYVAQNEKIDDAYLGRVSGRYESASGSLVDTLMEAVVG